jgi:hypothetical protein
MIDRDQNSDAGAGHQSYKTISIGLHIATQPPT